MRQSFGDGDSEQPNRSRSQYATPSPRPAAEFGQSVHRGARRHHKRRLGVRHAIRDGDQSVDVVDGIFGEPAIGREAVGAVALIHVAVVQAVVEASRVHALAAALALPAAGMDFHGDPLADAVLVHTWTERRHGAHIFVAGREHLIERFAAPDHRRLTMRYDFQISRADRDGIDAHQHLGAARRGDRLVHQPQLTGIVQYPGPHSLGHRETRGRF